ncbi:DNA repair protein RecO [Adhaeribacter radiodurans]|uniref:DNA repair protein RecO n=1 Tax=Adhaeribacter radiodurans TaxID=2745197 RepID=A0A7L7L2R4_9BACT|nr:DNA repair protein RecO [Adhaeribacter radiodurans]QMU27050.1 DNA repair protein RecO [Adhaeribacter radiodurans]
MLVKTRGIVLNFIKYRETSIIARVYTEQLGLQTYIVNSVRKKGPGARIALFQPFTLLDMVVYTSSKGGITRISEYKCNYPFSSIPFDTRKSSIVLFLSEVLAYTIQEEEENPPLFGFLYDSIVYFDQQEQGFSNFHLFFLLQLAHYLGFGPTSGADITSQVAFSVGTATQSRGSVLHFQMFEAYFDALMQSSEEVFMNNKVRKELLLILIRYYQLHVEKLGEIKSLQVLSEVLSD